MTHHNKPTRRTVRWDPNWTPEEQMEVDEIAADIGRRVAIRADTSLKAKEIMK